MTSDGDKHVSTSTERRDDANMDQALFRPPLSYRDSIYLHLVEETTGYRGFRGGGGEVGVLTTVSDGVRCVCV